MRKMEMSASSGRSHKDQAEYSASPKHCILPPDKVLVALCARSLVSFTISSKSLCVTSRELYYRFLITVSIDTAFKDPILNGGDDGETSLSDRIATISPF